MATRGRGIGAISSDVGNIRWSVPCPRRLKPAPRRSPPARCPETPEPAFGFDRNQCSDSIGILTQILGLATFMHAAGITCSQRLGDIVATLDPGGEAGAVALPGASAR
jgi:hypothetical protein